MAKKELSLDELRQAIADEEAKIQRKMQEEDVKLKAEGYGFKAIAWVHPKSGGDDYQIVCHFATRPTDADVVAILKKKRSAVLTDFQIIEL